MPFLPEKAKLKLFCDQAKYLQSDRTPRGYAIFIDNFQKQFAAGEPGTPIIVRSKKSEVDAHFRILLMPAGCW
jgi:hypothetical protein